MAALVQIAIELLLYESSECFIIQFLVPNLAREEVQSVLSTLRNTATSLSCENDAFSMDTLNTPDMLFVSTRLAWSFPDSVESLIVRGYKSYLPGALGNNRTSSLSIT